MVPAEVWHRVVHVSCGSKLGTGLVLDHENRQYLVTARHVVKSGIEPAIRMRGTVLSVGLTALTIPDAAADVAVFRLDQSIVPPGLPLVAGTKDMIFGQDAYFLGFPYGLTFNLGGEDFPLVKRCTISATNRSFQGRNVILLDGWNNPGFSGGPVVFRPLTAEGLQEPMKVAGARVAAGEADYGRYGGASPQPHRGTGACSMSSAPGCEFPSASRVPHSR